MTHSPPDEIALDARDDAAALAALGWGAAFEAAFQPFVEQGLIPARVVLEHKQRYRVATARGEHSAEVSGRFRHLARSPHEFPAVGDWVAIRPSNGDSPAVIVAVLPRRSSFSRQAAGDRVQEQVVAANLDTVFVLMGLDGDFNPRRLERYLIAAWRSGASPVVILNKADLADDPSARLALVHAVAPGVAVHLVSGRTGQGFEAVAAYLQQGRTVGFLGSSGVGKSTLINRLLGRERQRVQAVRDADSRGRHTTTHRELFVLQGGGLAIDTPGMLELQPWDAGESLTAAFDDIETLAQGCDFRDCQHQGEPDCAVEAAVAAGLLPAARLENWRKLQREQRHQELRQDVQGRQRQKQQIRAVTGWYNREHGLE